jgi:hypothetical protein
MRPVREWEHLGGDTTAQLMHAHSCGLTARGAGFGRCRPHVPIMAQSGICRLCKLCHEGAYVEQAASYRPTLRNPSFLNYRYLQALMPWWVCYVLRHTWQYPGGINLHTVSLFCHSCTPLTDQPDLSNGNAEERAGDRRVDSCKHLPTP